MADKESRPRAPAGLAGSGRSLWASTTAEFELDEHELAILREACRTATAIDALQAVVDRDGVLNESSQGVSRVAGAAVVFREIGEPARHPC